MNNSLTTYLELEEKIDNKPMLRQRETEIVEIIEAIERIINSNYWKIIREKVYDPDIEILKHQLITEQDTIKLYRLQGKVDWIDKNLDLTKLLTSKKNELINIRRQLHGTESN